MVSDRDDPGLPLGPGAAVNERRACLSCWGYGTLEDNFGMLHECPDCDGTGEDLEPENDRRESARVSTGVVFTPRTMSGTRRVAR